MKKENAILWFLVVLFAIMMSIPFLIPGTGPIALIGFVPLLCMERIADMMKKKKIWIYHYSAFVLWNALTTFWVCNATFGGGLFAIFANALQMSVVFGLFRFSKKRFNGALPYIFLAAAWIAWERFYFDTDISWPWLVLGNAFARSTWAVQWYEYTGTLGGSLWVWLSNLAIFGLMTALSEGKWNLFNSKAKLAIFIGLGLLFICPFIVSPIIGKRYNTAFEEGEKLPVLVIQPNIDPYSKFQALSQEQQNVILLSLAENNLKDRLHDSTAGPLLIVTPETFTSDVVTYDFSRSHTWHRFTEFLKHYPNVNMLFGASSYDYINSKTAPSATARKVRNDLWVESHNSALITDGSKRTEIFHKSKLVVAVEKTPYPKFFCPIDDALGGVMGRCVGQEEISVLNVRGRFPDGAGNDGNIDGMAVLNNNIPIGCAICYESVYGEYYTGYIKKGAKAMTVITNDAWWGNTPGYKQHLSYSCLRAIETRRAIARCANTGISAIISPSGKIIEQTPWWEQAVIKSEIPLRDDITFFVAHGDIIGRLCNFLFWLLLAALGVRIITGNKSR